MNGVLQKRQALHRQLQFREEQYNHLIQQSDQLHTLAAVGMAWAMTAHEMNNLLTPVGNYAQLALSHPEDKELAQKALTKAMMLSQKATEMLQRVMVLAGQKPFSTQEVSIKSLIEDVFGGIGRDFEKDNIRVSVQVPDDLFIWADGPSLRQVLMNLILNARQAMLGQPGELRIRAYCHEDAVWIEIIDTGRGIAPAALRQIFDPFYSTKKNCPDGPNNGLGLSFCKRIIEKHDGLISVESEVGKGTCFKIRLPKKDGTV
jgi:signal transduction histidine kinase